MTTGKWVYIGKWPIAISNRDNLSLIDLNKPHNGLHTQSTMTKGEA